MNEASILKPALIGGILIGILSSLPYINHPCFCCAWIIGGGVLAANLYVKESLMTVTLGRGITVGLLTGVIGTVVFALFSIPLHFMTNAGKLNLMEEMNQALNRMPNVPAQTRQMMEALAASSSMQAVFMVFIMLFMLATYCLLSMIGGAIGVAIFEKRKPGVAPEEAPSYQPPSTLPPPPPPTDGV